MPCLSLIHRKIYQETVAKRIAARRAVMLTQRKAERAARQAAKKAAKAERAAQKSLLKQQTAKAQLQPQAPQFQTQPVQFQPQSSPLQSQSSPIQSQVQALSTLQSKLVSATEKEVGQKTDRKFISSVLREFQEDVPVYVEHRRPKITMLEPKPQSAATSSAIESRPTVAKPVVAPQPSTRLFGRSFARRRPTRAELINAESCLGRTLFGPIPSGHRREFFHDHDNIWIWYESWTEANREPHQVTVRYEVRPTGVYKKLSAGHYSELEDHELENFRLAAHAYLNLIKHNLYHLA